MSETHVGSNAADFPLLVESLQARAVMWAREAEKQILGIGDELHTEYAAKASEASSCALIVSAYLQTIRVVSWSRETDTPALWLGFESPECRDRAEALLNVGKP